jgi:spore coat polysaccharide biosynthesis protein SpsF
LAVDQGRLVILAILQARLSSTRLPRKVLKPILGEPMIVRQIERIRRSALIDRLVVATSTDASDDSLVAELEGRGIEVRRGPLDDVVRRFAGIVMEFKPTTIVRLTADCPLTDATVIDRVINAHLASSSDYSSNTISPTYPDGLDVECVTSSAFRRLLRLPLTDREREHVTLGIYSRLREFSVTSVTQEVDWSGLRWTVDVPDDLEFVRTVYTQLYDGDNGFDQTAILELLARKPELNRTELDLARNAGSSQ